MHNELEELYQEIILDHNRRPRNDGKLEAHTHTAEGYNPLCGDQLTVYLRKSGETIEAISCDCQGCAISRASGSIMTTMVSGKSTTEARAQVAEIQRLLTAKEEPEVDLDEQGDLAALIGVRQFPARIKCATLAWHALETAIDGCTQASSE